METIPAKSIVNRTKDPSWFGTEYNMNIYRGCCHGCIYCDSRSASSTNSIRSGSRPTPCASSGTTWSARSNRAWWAPAP